MTTLAYVRVSTETQVEGFGLDEQIDACRRVAAELDHPLDAVFEDGGVSGKEGLACRTGLAQVLDRLQAAPPGPSTLIIPRLDRLARDLIVQERLLAEIWQTGAQVIPAAPAERLACHPDDPDDPARKLIRQVLGAIAGYERDMIRLRLTCGRNRKIAAIGWAGGPEPYGWSNPLEQAVLAEVTGLRRAGVTWHYIAELLNAEGKFKRNGRPWRFQEIQKQWSRSQKRQARNADRLPLPS